MSGAGFSTMVLPVASAWATFTIETSKGKFHGVMAPTTPTGTLRTIREVAAPDMASTTSGNAVSHWKRSISSIGQEMAWASGRAICGPPSHSMRGAPASWISSSRELVLHGGQPLLELLEAVLAEGVVRGPVGVVEGPTGRVDGPAHVRGGGVGHLTDDLLGGGVDVVERPTRLGVHAASRRRASSSRA